LESIEEVQMSFVDKERSAVRLPHPRIQGPDSLESCIHARRSVRSFSKEALTLDEISQLLWSAQGITAETGERAAPSAGATYPLETYLVADNVAELEAGVYKYEVARHQLRTVQRGTCRDQLARAALGQDCVRVASAALMFTAVYARTEEAYGKAAKTYVHIEVGHAAENVCLQAVSLGLGTVCVGVLRDAEVRRLLNLPDEEVTLYMVAVGRIER
jgi:SagB-type dehydrogenase family enzyme